MGWGNSTVATRTYGFEKTANSEEGPHRQIYTATKLGIKTRNLLVGSVLLTFELRI